MKEEIMDNTSNLKLIRAAQCLYYGALDQPALLRRKSGIFESSNNQNKSGSHSLSSLLSFKSGKY